MSSVIILTGPSGCGKSEIIRILKEIGNENKYKNKFTPVMIPKYTTRNFRSLELEFIKDDKKELLDVKPVYGADNIVLDKNGKPLSYDEQVFERMRLFSELNCDLVYEQYGNRYGVHIAEIYKNMKLGNCPIIILNDIRAVEDLKTFFGDKCISLFIFRKSPQINDYKKIGEERNSDLNDAVTRFNKANSIYRIYIENIHMFDKLVLNTQNNFDSLNKLLHELVNEICNSQYTLFREGGDKYDKLYS